MKEQKGIFKKSAKRWMSFMLFTALVFSAFCAGVWGREKIAKAATQAEAVAWANSQVGKGLDYDGQYGNQCVDLIKYYYAYFGVANYATGNANAYISNQLPPGWSRVYGNYQAGDVAVWKVNHSCKTCNTGPLGHVGIITSADGVGFNAVNQNFNNTPSCTQNWFNISALQCAIRPAYSNGGNNPQGNANELSYSQLKTEWVDNWNASLYGRIENPGKIRLSQVGVYIWDNSGNLVVNHRENCTLATSYVEQRLNIVSEAKADGLIAGTNYTFQMYAIANGKTYYSGKSNFKTAGQAPATPTPKPTPKPTPVPTPVPTSVPTPVSTPVPTLKPTVIPTPIPDVAQNPVQSNPEGDDIVDYSDEDDITDIILKEENMALTVGEEKKISFKTEPEDTEPEDLEWISSNEDVAEVDDYGRVTAVSAGKATITVQTEDGEVSAALQVTVMPQTATLTSVKSSKKKITLKWERVDEIGGYQVSFGLKSSFKGAKNKNVSAKNTSVTLTNLKSKKYYYLRIRTYQTVSGKKYYSGWSQISKIRVK